MDLTYFHLPPVVSLALVALIGYLVGRRRAEPEMAAMVQLRREVQRAQRVAGELEKITLGLHKELAAHEENLRRFKEQMSQCRSEQDQAAFQELCRAADGMLGPTLHLATQIAEAHDRLRQQSSHLMSFAEARTDALTGVHNRRAFDDALASQFALRNRYGNVFSVAIFDIDHFKRVNDKYGHLHGDQVLQEVAKVLDDLARETDMIARYGGEEFVLVMPNTDLGGACISAERIRIQIGGRSIVTVSAGVTSVTSHDTPNDLLARADAALYAAKAAGRNRVFRHSGAQIEPLPASEELLGVV